MAAYVCLQQRASSAFAAAGAFAAAAAAFNAAITIIITTTTTLFVTAAVAAAAAMCVAPGAVERKTDELQPIPQRTWGARLAVAAACVPHDAAVFAGCVVWLWSQWEAGRGRVW